MTKYLVLNVTFKVLVLSTQVVCMFHTNVNMFAEVFHRKTSEVFVLLHQVVPTQYKYKFTLKPHLNLPPFAGETMVWKVKC